MCAPKRNTTTVTYVANPPPGGGHSYPLRKFKMNPKTYSTRPITYAYPRPPPLLLAEMTSDL